MTLEELQNEYEQQKAQILCLKKTLEHLIQSGTNTLSALEDTNRDVTSLRLDVARLLLNE